MTSDRDRLVDTGQRAGDLVAGKYELVRLIGRGGMGSVWEGRHASLGTRVAIKFIEAQYAGSTDARQRFDTEARAAATIESKHAIQVFDHGMMEDGRPYIVMELLVGQPLDARLEQIPRMPPQDTARIVLQVCRALQRAHDRGIIHRDLKPENIFLVQSPDDDDEIAKVLDFGIAKIRATPGATHLSSGTKTGTLLGTPFFMSPEQARGLRNVDHRTDLWAIGVIVFRCLTGVLPFDGESLGDLLVKICTAPIPIPSQAAPGMTPELDRWMQRALDREPERRFQSALELAEALAAATGLAIRRAGASSQIPGSYVQSSGPVAARGGAAVTPAHRSPAPYAPATSASPYGTPIPAATSAPFTSPTPPATPSSLSSRGVLLGVAVVGSLATGVLVVLLWSGVLSRRAPQATVSVSIAAGSAPGESSAARAATAAPAPENSAGLLLDPVDTQGLPVASASAPRSAAHPSLPPPPPPTKPARPAPVPKPPTPAANAPPPAASPATARNLPPTPAPHAQKPPLPSEQSGY